MLAADVEALRRIESQVGRVRRPVKVGNLALYAEELARLRAITVAINMLPAAVYASRFPSCDQEASSPEVSARRRGDPPRMGRLQSGPLGGTP